MDTSYLLDKDFLAKLDTQQHREIYARIAALDIEENPLEYIEGKVTGGSINIDGTSTVRRTCNITMVCREINITDFYWGIKSKFKLQIGLKNDLEPKYPNIVWFPQGTYLIASFNTSIGVNQCNISIAGKDKMCMLNGDMGGSLPSSIDFGQEEYLDYDYQKHTFNTPYEYTTGKYYIATKQYELYTGSFDTRYFKYNRQYYIKKDDSYVPVDVNSMVFSQPIYIQKYELSNAPYSTRITYYDQVVTKQMIQIPLYRIIREAVHTWANEPYHNIIINDLDTFGLEQLQYRGEKPLYALRALNDEVYTQMTMKQDKKFYIVSNKQLNSDGTVDPVNIFSTPHVLSEFLDNGNLKAETATDGVAAIDRNELTWITFDAPANKPVKAYTVLVLKYGEDAGYRITDLVYAGTLISSIGDSVTSVLDKIKTMLGDFEYFYNLDGQFIFQRKRTCASTSWNSIQEIEDDTYVEPSELASPITYSFIGNKLITAFNNTPALNSVKNDYSVWGIRKGVADVDLPIHTRYAIDKKPFYYKAFDGKIYVSSEELFEEVMAHELAAIEEDTIDKIANFTQREELLARMPASLQRATRQPDGSWSAGWWNIEDWRDYYVLLTGKEPMLLMKEYASSSSLDGCVKSASLTDITWGAGQGRYEYVWLIHEGNDGKFYAYHNGGYPPYNGCFHRYRDFLPGGKVYQAEGVRACYFYNPDFPERKSETELVNERIIELKRYYKENGILNLVDWREIIYQMALDYFKYSNADLIDNEYNLPIKDIFLQKVAKNNGHLYPNGYTGYEQYYTDIQGFWRQLYNPSYEPNWTFSTGSYQDSQVVVNAVTGIHYSQKTWEDAKITGVQADFYLPISITEDSYVAETDEEKQLGAKIINFLQRAKSELSAEKYNEVYNELARACVGPKDSRRGWNRTVFEAPETLNFWFDFLDDESELAHFSVKNIGDRSKVVNDTKITGIYYKQIPEFIFANKFDKEEFDDKPGYTFLYLASGLENLFTISYRGKSAKDETDSLLYQFSYCAENITITALPVYYLEPNVRIFVSDDETGINGEYIVSKMTIPLTYNGTMSITANKAPVRLY